MMAGLVKYIIINVFTCTAYRSRSTITYIGACVEFKQAENLGVAERKALGSGTK